MFSKSNFRSHIAYNSSFNSLEVHSRDELNDLVSICSEEKHEFYFNSKTGIFTSSNFSRRSISSSFDDFHSESSSSDILDGWEEVLDENTGRIYYSNSITKQRQHKRPTSSKLLRKSNDSHSDSFTNKLLQRRETNRKVEKVISTEDLVCDSTHFRPIHPAPPASESKANIARKNVVDMINNPIMKWTSSYTTLTKMEELGTTLRIGYLMKQSKYLSRWLEKYFILSAGRLEYHDDHRPRKGKIYEITGSTSVSSYAKDRCFIVKALKRNDKIVDPLIIMAPNDNDLENWILSINSHIYMQFKHENHITIDYWDEGSIETSFWKLPALNEDYQLTSPFEILSLPVLNGPVTKECIYPGETVEIVQTIKDNFGTTFLRLANDKGWIYDKKPSDKFDLFEKIKGDYVEEKRTYLYPLSQTAILDTFSGPSILSTPIENSIIIPGSTFQVDAVWTCNSNSNHNYYSKSNMNSINNTDNDEFQESITYLRLICNRSWVAISSQTTIRLLSSTKLSTSSAMKFV